MRAVLSAWAEADGSTVAGKVEQIVRVAVEQARDRVERDLAEARDELEATASLLPLLLRKGPNEVLVPGDIPAGGGDIVRLAGEVLGSLGDAADLPRVQAAINDAAARYQRAAKTYAAFAATSAETEPEEVAPRVASAAGAAVEAVPVWTVPSVAPAVRAPERFDGDREPLLIPDAIAPALRGERLDPVIDPIEERNAVVRGAGAAGTAELSDARGKRPLRLFAKGGSGGSGGGLSQI
jgi:hypothetical protein